MNSRRLIDHLAGGGKCKQDISSRGASHEVPKETLRRNERHCRVQNSGRKHGAGPFDLAPAAKQLARPDKRRSRDSTRVTPPRPGCAATSRSVDDEVQDAQLVRR